MWTKDEEDYLALCIAHDVGSHEIAARWLERFGYDRGYEAINKARSTRRRVTDLLAGYEQLAKKDLPPLDSVPTIIPRTAWEGEPPEDRWDVAEKRNAKLIEYHKDRHHARIEYQADRPIAISFIADQHITTNGPTDLRRMRQDAELIRDTPGLYACLGGDGVDNHIKHQSAMIGSGSKPSEQWTLYDHYLGLFGYKIAAMISGNHDDWTKDTTDLDMAGRLAKSHRIFFAPDVVNLEVALLNNGTEQKYRLKLRHQYRFNSTLHLGHAIKRMWEMDQDDFDVGVLCHIHEPHCETFFKHGLVRIALRPGSYQFTSTHSRRYGFGQVTPTCPTVILFPGERRMMEFKDVREAASYLTWLRQGWPKTADVFAA
jgi:hypothetical protein